MCSFINIFCTDNHSTFIFNFEHSFPHALDWQIYVQSNHAWLKGSVMWSIWHEKVDEPTSVTMQDRLSTLMINLAVHVMMHLQPIAHVIYCQIIWIKVIITLACPFFKIRFKLWTKMDFNELNGRFIPNRKGKLKCMFFNG